MRPKAGRQNIISFFLPFSFTSCFKQDQGQVGRPKSLNNKDAET